jgi:uncharacterized protein (DUF488 family)
MNIILTIGHSTHEIEVFLKLLNQHRITAIADVRSYPYSKYSPQYSREALQSVLQQNGISYVFLGKELGARTENPACYRNGKVQFELLAKDTLFLEGLERIRQGIQNYRIALMCAEKDPLECHRAVLVGRSMYGLGTAVEHIHADGHIESHDFMESRMLQLYKLSDLDIFRTRAEVIAEAYRIHGDRIAYQDEVMREVELNKGTKQ